jgi:hypothetical protein
VRLVVTPRLQWHGERVWLPLSPSSYRYMLQKTAVYFVSFFNVTAAGLCLKSYVNSNSAARRLD